MAYLDQIRTAGSDPEALEQSYRHAVKNGAGAAFTSAVETAYVETPDNVLLGAWHFRLAYDLIEPPRRAIPWLAAIVLAAANGLIFWWLSAEQYRMRVEAGTNYLPTLLILWAPISAIFVIALLLAAGAARRLLALLLGALVVALGAYPLWARTLISVPILQGHYLDQMMLHVALLAWATVGIFLLYGCAGPPNRFAFLVKSLEIFVMAGLFAIAGGIFTAITVGLFEALAVTLSESVLRLIVAGGAGLIPVLAVAVIYDPGVAPAEQSFDEGLSKVIATLMRLLLPLTLIVLIVYLGFIPFHFWEPFRNRDVLIIYNAMLFAVIALLVGATPIQLETLAPVLRVWLRRGLIAVALLAALVSLYALAAIAYRTWQGGITLNRLTIIGWNVIHIGILAGLLARQVRANGYTWLAALQAAYCVGMPLYLVWAIFVVLATPWLFR